MLCHLLYAALVSWPWVAVPDPVVCGKGTMRRGRYADQRQISETVVSLSSRPTGQKATCSHTLLGTVLSSQADIPLPGKERTMALSFLLFSLGSSPLYAPEMLVLSCLACSPPSLCVLCWAPKAAVDSNPEVRCYFGK